ncbi:MAG: UvrD-helicase domain-containing protein [Candidatus Cardinium sp.]|nr:UvrD-helicase domain-containing protein [Candidatus Cardinium sp.]
MAALLLYRASAGAGKTHTLVTQYIKWALCDTAAFEHILAVTFTNQATREMKQRIMTALHSLANGEATALQKELFHMGWTHEPLQVGSRALLSRMVYQYESFAVTTIDSFFYKIVQSFSEELCLQQHFAVEMDEALALEESVALLLQSDLPLLQKWLVDFALENLLAGKRWHIAAQLQQLGKTLYKESFKLHEKALLAALEEEDVLPYFLADLQSNLLLFEEKMQKTGKKALALLEQEKLAPEDFSYGNKGIIGYFRKIAHTKAFAPTKRALLAATAVASWIPKRTTKNKQLTRVITDELHPLLVEAIALYDTEGIRYRTAIAVARFVYSFGLMAALLKELEQYRRRHNVLFLSDIATLLYHFIQENDTPFLYERIGNKFHHFLIDEFQDLSLFQWVNIKPLLLNSLAQGYDNLLVGDVKQSIYRWRGSDWRLLNHQVEAAFEGTKVHALRTNRRSHKAIVSFNNTFFSAAADQLMRYLEVTLSSAKEAAAPLRYEWEQMKRVYGDIAQELLPITQQGGYVELLLLKSHPLDSLSKAPLNGQLRVQKEIIHLLKKLKNRSIAAKDIVLLVRNNREAALVEELCRGLYAARDGYMPAQARSLVWDHVAVKVIIYALYYLNSAEELMHKMALIQAYSNYIGQESINWHHYIRKGSEVTAIAVVLPKTFWDQKAFLQSLPLYACVDLLIKILFAEEEAYNAVLAFFQGMVLDYCHKAATDTLQAFLSWWEKRGKTFPLPVNSDEDMLQIMTIHQAKGLEFKVVIIPFCNWNLDHIPQKGPLLWCAPYQQAPFHYFPVLPLHYSEMLKATYYAQDYYLEHMQAHLDNFNLLYVAFTRAKEQLYVMALLPEQEGKLLTTADLIYRSLVACPTDESGGLSVVETLAATVEETPIDIRFCLG